MSIELGIDPGSIPLSVLGTGHNKGFTQRDNPPDKPVIIMLDFQWRTSNAYNSS